MCSAWGEHLRGIIHRVAGVALMAVGIYHVFYVIAAREGRRLLRDLAPRPNDGFDALRAMRYYLGFSKVKPEFARFNYAEKAEYWALVWGHGTDGRHRRDVVGQGLGGEPAGSVVG